MKGFALRLALKKRHKRTRKWPILKLNSDTHNRNTRFSNLNFNCPRYKNETEGGRTFTVRSIKEWNNLDKDLKELKNAKALKKKVIKNLLSKQNSNMNFL